MPLTPETKALALSEIRAYQTTLWQKVTGEDIADDEVSVTAKHWLNSLVQLTQGTIGENVPNFTFIEHDAYMRAVMDEWVQHWGEIRVLRAQLFGLSASTAQTFVEEVLTLDFSK